MTKRSSKRSKVQTPSAKGKSSKKPMATSSKKLAPARGPILPAKPMVTKQNRADVLSAKHRFTEVVATVDLESGAMPQLLTTVPVSPTSMGGRVSDMAMLFQKWKPHKLNFYVQSAMPTTYSGSIALVWSKEITVPKFDTPYDLQKYVSEQAVCKVSQIYDNHCSINIPIKLLGKFLEVYGNEEDTAVYGAVHLFLYFPFSGPSAGSTGMMTLSMDVELGFELPASPMQAQAPVNTTVRCLQPVTVLQLNFADFPEYADLPAVTYVLTNQGVQPHYKTTGRDITGEMLFEFGDSTIGYKKGTILKPADPNEFELHANKAPLGQFYVIQAYPIWLVADTYEHALEISQLVVSQAPFSKYPICYTHVLTDSKEVTNAEFITGDLSGSVTKRQPITRNVKVTSPNW